MSKEFITHNDVVRAGDFCTVDASDLGWPPGQLLRQLPTDLGNSRPFILYDANDDGFYYRQQFGSLSLIIIND